MKTKLLRIHRATPQSDPLHVFASELFPTPGSEFDAATKLALLWHDGEKLAQALCRALPSGTIEALVIVLLRMTADERVERMSNKPPATGFIFSDNFEHFGTHELKDKWTKLSGR